MSSETLWRDVVGFEGRYQVSSRGEVRTVAHVMYRSNGQRQTIAARLRKLPVTTTGYRTVRMGQSTHKVHVLVAAAFIGPRPAGDIQIRHLDGNKLNNTSENLVYGTRSENAQDTLVHGTHALGSRTHCGYGHPLSGANVRWSGKGWRRDCRECAARRMAEFRARAALAKACAA